MQLFSGWTVGAHALDIGHRRQQQNEDILRHCVDSGKGFCHQSYVTSSLVVGRLEHMPWTLDTVASSKMKIYCGIALTQEKVSVISRMLPVSVIGSNMIETPARRSLVNHGHVTTRLITFEPDITGP